MPGLKRQVEGKSAAVRAGRASPFAGVAEVETDWQAAARTTAARAKDKRRMDLEYADKRAGAGVPQTCGESARLSPVARLRLDGGLVSRYLPIVTTTNLEAQLDAVGDPTRRAILARLREGPLPVGTLARGFPMSRPAISQHLRVLKDANLVIDRPDGTKRIYELNPQAFASLREYFDELWGVALLAFKQRVENPKPRRNA